MPTKTLLHSATILVTGGAGFIGSHLLEVLRKQYPDAHLYSLDNYFTGSENNHIGGVSYVRGSTIDIGSLIQTPPDIVYHLGEYSRVEKSFEDADIVFESNIRGTRAVLDYCRKHSAKIIYAGSSTKFADNGAGRGQSPYAWSKAVNTELVTNYASWYGLNHAITYFYNVYGGREIAQGNYATVIAIFQEQFRKGIPLSVVSPGTQKRNFTHISDIINGLVLVGEIGYGDGYELGASEAYSILDVASMFNHKIIMLPERKGNRFEGIPNTAKASVELKWKPSVKLDSYIQHITNNKGSFEN